MKRDIRVAVDAVVFGYDPENGVSVLLIRRKLEPFRGMWALPGGFVKVGESLDQAVKRELGGEAGVDVHYLEQLFSFGDPYRDPRGHVVSISFFGLVRPRDCHPVASSDAEDVAWHNIRKLPNLAFDHKKIIDVAIKRLRGKLTYEPVGFELLDREFAFSDLEKLYMTFLDRELDRRNFRKKLMGLGVVEELDKSVQRGSGRPARLFRFNRKRYLELKEKGYHADMFS